MKSFMYKILGFVLVLLVLDCNNLEKPKKPKNLIPEDKMVNILIDMSLLSAAKGLNKKLLEENHYQPDKYIYTKHNIDSTQFVLSSNYYAYDPETYQEIYNKVNDSLMALQTYYEEKDKEEKALKKKKRDSLKKAKNKDVIVNDSIIPKLKNKDLPERHLPNNDSLPKLKKTLLDSLDT